jgi:hypothetical protein
MARTVGEAEVVTIDPPAVRPDPTVWWKHPQARHRQIRVCLRCQCQYRPSRHGQKFCSNYCSMKNRWERRVPFGPLEGKL